MAELVSTIQNYQGLSNETKPSDAPKGSRFYETDTELWYRYTGQEWVAQRTAAVEVEQSRIDIKDLLEGMSLTLKDIKDLIEDKL